MKIKTGKRAAVKDRRPAPRKAKARAEVWQLHLYVTDRTQKSLTALSNLRRICEAHLKGRYRITVIDLLKRPQLARGDQILAIPTVVRKSPRPLRTLIGTLSDTDNVLSGLDLRPVDQPEPSA